uniref:Choline transporter-like protein n=1 Tax=Cyclophora tenuis TaxID=216820 RepID=A0A7S1CX49_CYCTE|mmetsp:Transcript_13087/g.22245  ORF Transcript_13087/g.22245 Transcript_13087/m.22245 type:complete len:524 (+) Transcript_13087:1-1572(+)
MSNAAEPLPVIMAPPRDDLHERLLPMSPPEAQNVTMDAETQEDWTRGEKQPSICRDWFFALLFYAHLATIITLAILWGIPSLRYPNSFSKSPGNLTATASSVANQQTTNGSFFGYFYLLLFLGAGSLVVSSLVLAIMTRFSQVLIQISIIFNIFASIFLMVMFASSGNNGAVLAAFISFAIFSCYAFAVWDRIPFAAANLTTGVTAIRTNIGVAFVPVLMSLLAWVYIFFWVVALYGTFMTSDQNCDQNDKHCNRKIEEVIVAIYLVALFWTLQVISNVTHVTAAGVVGTWWFAPEEASSMCSKSVCDSFSRSTLSSFGSICLGSLLAGIAQILHEFVHSLRRERNAGGGSDSLLLCLVECLLSIIESLVRYFNRWAFVYVGLYGYSYLEAGEKVMKLFTERGWGTIINDRLVTRVLVWMALLIGAMNGLFGWILVRSYPGLLAGMTQNTAAWIAFSTGFLIGTGVANILMTLVSSSVDTVVVCFAEAPTDFRLNHSELSEKMENAWMATYPQEYHGNRALDA